MAAETAAAQVAVSVVIPSLVRESLYPLMADLLGQQFDRTFEIVVIAQPPGRIDRSRIQPDPRVRVHEEPLGRGFGHYRQVGTELAAGRVLAWIDDDERPMNERWLAEITAPILDQSEQVVTAGYHIPLGQGYLADSISWLGLPGGGYPGFEVMWTVDDEGYTDHLCTGNFAIAKDVLTGVGGFDIRMRAGNEDTDLADRLRAAGVRIAYQATATVLHEARSKLGCFMRWHVERGIAHRELLSGMNAGRHRSKVGRRLRSSLAIVRRVAATRYLPGVLFAMTLQYACQLVGYLRLGTAHRHD
jgi:GT2 family glycosyltransferase